MAYNTYTSRTDLTNPPEDLQREIVAAVPETSMIMRLGNRRPNMSRKQRRIRVLDQLPEAFFVNGDTGFKQTTNIVLRDEYLNAEELAVIVPIPEAVLDDEDYDIFGEYKPQIAAAFGKAFDAAVIKGTNAPATWPDDILTQSAAAGNTKSLAAFADLYDALAGVGGVMDAVEQDDYDVTGHLAVQGMKARYRGLRDAEGRPIFVQAMTDREPDMLFGNKIVFAKNRAITSADCLQISGDFDKLLWALRQDLTFKLLDQAVISDPATGLVIQNLAQQDMVALRCVMRIAWTIPIPVSTGGLDADDIFPFGVLTA